MRSSAVFALRRHTVGRAAGPVYGLGSPYMGFVKSKHIFTASGLARGSAYIHRQRKRESSRIGPSGHLSAHRFSAGVSGVCAGVCCLRFSYLLT